MHPYSIQVFTIFKLPAGDRPAAYHFPPKDSLKNAYSAYSEWTDIPVIPFILLSGAEWREYYSAHSETGIGPKRTRMPSIPSLPIPEWCQKNAPQATDQIGV